MLNELETLSFRIKEKVIQFNKSGICVSLENTVSSLLNYYLSLRTNLPVHVTSIIFLGYEYPEVSADWFVIDERVEYLGKNYLNTFLLEKSEQNNLLLLSNRDYVERNYVRNYHRSEIVDYFPLHKASLGEHWPALRWSEINKLYNEIDFKQFPKYKEICEKLPKPNDKAYGTDITYEEYEWLMDIEKLYNYDPIIKNNNDPTKHSKWFTFNIRQKQIIAQLHQIEKNTRYKAKNTNAI